VDGRCEDIAAFTNVGFSCEDRADRAGREWLATTLQHDKPTPVRDDVENILHVASTLHPRSFFFVGMVMCGTPCFVYRLSDIVNGYLGRHTSGNVTKSVCSRWPASIGCVYLKQAAGRSNAHDVLCREAARRADYEKRPLEQPLDVVHLRLGDVLDWPYYRQHRRQRFYLHPLEMYERVAIPRNVSSVTIMGDVNYRFRSESGNERSLKFRNNVSRILRARGLSVRFRPQNATADEDFVFALTARSLMTGRGGFADLLARCARARGVRLW
jgi:hypothetical protein